MWANWEIAAFMDWLKDYNRSAQPKVGFYGLDLYSLWESMQVLVEYLEKQDKKTARLAREAMKCFQPYGEEGIGYAQASTGIVPASCQQEVLELLQEVRRKAYNYDHEPEAPLNAEMNAWVAVNAERYYKSMTSFRADSWNIRDTHMADTLNRLMNFHGNEAKVIVWEHNTHIGDARFTDMKRRGTINVGQLVREQQKEGDVVLVGFGSYQGSVIAGDAWGAPMQKMQVPEAIEGSVEDLLHQESSENKLLIFNPSHPQERFNQSFPHRAIGVVYEPQMERFGNYVPSILARRYDAFLYIDQSTALHPLHMEENGYQIPDTFPFAV
jgi:erythromycin esterase-like protein